MKRIVKVVANDGSSRIEVTARITSNNSFTRTETNRIAQELARGIADGLRPLSYTNFGPDNTDVRA